MGMALQNHSQVDSLDHLGALIVVVDQSGSILWQNEAFTDLCGLSPARTTRMRFWEFLMPTAEVNAFKARMIVREPGQAMSPLRSLFFGKDDKLVPVVWNFTDNRMEDFPARSLIVTGINVALLATSTFPVLHLMQSLQESSIPAMLLDFNGYIEYANAALMDHSHLPRHKVIGASFGDIINPDGSEAVFEDLLAELQASGEWQGVVKVRTEIEHDIWLQCMILAFQQKQTDLQSHFLVLAEDISEAKRLEEINKNLEDEISRQFHLTQIGLLTSGIAHNLRNPLSAILMASEMISYNLQQLLEKPGQDPYEVFETLEEMERMSLKVFHNAKRIDRIVNDITNYQRQNRTRITDEVDLNSVIMTDIAVIREEFKSKYEIDITIDLHTEPIHVHVRASDIGQIFLNLTTNARDAMLESVLRLLHVRTGIDTENQLGWFEVRDTGSGISDDVMKRMGEPFVTTKSDDPEAKRRGSGTGLGLYMIHRLLEQWNGTMKVQSQPGDTSFRIFFPLSVEETGNDALSEE
ncbi:PAS domain-containing protein [bacterium]|nr:PAS domain-containing protein [bacterium]